MSKKQINPTTSNKKQARLRILGMENNNLSGNSGQNK
jgi:hypothetical protein